MTEGPFDSMFLPNAVAMVGASKSISLPDKLRMRDVVFCLDNEPRSVEIVNMMRNLVAKEHKVFIPDNRLEQLANISKSKKNRSSISPLNNFLRAPEIVITKIDKYKNI